MSNITPSKKTDLKGVSFS